jgi:hypothetical protein
MRYCPDCGVAINANPKFCPECGFNLKTLNPDATETLPAATSHRSVGMSDPTIRKGVIALIQLVVGAIAFFYIYTHFIHPSDSPTPISTSQSATSNNNANRSSVTFNGTGGLNEQTAPQELSGNYEIDWKVNGSCYYSASIGTTDIFSADGPTSGKNYLTNLTDGNYSISMITGPAPTCSWSAVFVPTN